MISFMTVNYALSAILCSLIFSKDTTVRCVFRCTTNLSTPFGTHCPCRNRPCLSSPSAWRREGTPPFSRSGSSTTCFPPSTSGSLVFILLPARSIPSRRTKRPRHDSPTYLQPNNIPTFDSLTRHSISPLRPGPRRSRAARGYTIDR